jgi:hypothetical protein
MFLNRGLKGKWLCWTSLIAMVAISCSTNESRLSEHTAAGDQWAKRAWLDKTARVLRYGEGISPADDVESLMALDREAIVDRLMNDPRFLDTTLDFNLFFLGFKPPKLWVRNVFPPNERRYADEVLAFPQVISAARAVGSDGDYFSLFDYEQPVYLTSFSYPSPREEGEVPQPAMTPEQIRELRIFHITAALQRHDEATAIFSPDQDSGRSAEEICTAGTEKLNLIGDEMIKAGFPFGFIQPIFFNYFEVQLACFLKIPADNFATLMSLRDTFAHFLALVDNPAATSNYEVRSVNDIAIADAERSKFGSGFTQPYSFTFWQTLQNSSTNYNRRRAAYILNSYFCDDLPETHGSNRHADDPSCASCHYKLDPMAGFFRHNGIGGLNFQGKPLLLFDDQSIFSEEKLETYTNSWKASEGQPRQWNIGYIRSPKTEKLNSYGESLPDLHRIFRTAREVRQCLTKRMAEYFLGKDQVFDGGWMDHLTQNFDRAAVATDTHESSRAYRAVVKSLVLSNTFTHPDPETGKCYDYAPGQQASDLPCEIAFNIQSNCASCHTGNSAAGGLDLASWQTSETPGASNFRHLDEDGKQIAKSITMERIASRLSSGDENYAMPFRKFMKANDRAQLFQWANREAQNSRGGN